MDPYTVGAAILAIVGAIGSANFENNTRITLNEIDNKLDEIRRLIFTVLDAIADLKKFVLTNSEDQFRHFIASEIDALLLDYHDKIAPISDFHHLTAKQRSDFLELADKVKTLGYQLFDWGGAAYPAAAQSIGMALVCLKLGRDQTAATKSVVGHFLNWFSSSALVEYTNAATAFQNEFNSKKQYVDNFPKRGFLGDSETSRVNHTPDGPEIDTDYFSFYYDIPSQNFDTGFSYNEGELSRTERSADESNPRHLPTPSGLGLSTPPDENLKEIVGLLNNARSDAQKAQANLKVATSCISDIHAIIDSLKKLT
jgi:hypothetical protein